MRELCVVGSDHRFEGPHVMGLGSNRHFDADAVDGAAAVRYIEVELDDLAKAPGPSSMTLRRDGVPTLSVAAQTRNVAGYAPAHARSGVYAASMLGSPPR